MTEEQNSRGRRLAYRFCSSALVGAIVVGGALGLSDTALASSSAGGQPSLTRAAVPQLMATEVGLMNASLFPAWCPFGTHGGKGKGCRGGSINDNKRLNDTLKDTGRMYKDAAECALVGVGTGLAEGDPMRGSWVPAAECGSEKPEGQF